MTHLISNVEILYPRVNQCYRFDNAENKSIPCDVFEDGAKYETKFRMDKDQAKSLYEAMAIAYAEKREKSWPQKLAMPFEKDDDGKYVGKAVLKGAYGKDATAKPKQYDAKSKELPEDFKLTTGSVGNIAVVFVPYNMRDNGVSLRLKAVQVTKYQAPQSAASPFDVVDGFELEVDENPFEVQDVPKAAAEAVSDDIVEDEPKEKVSEPKKIVKKTAPAPKDDADLASIVDEWDD